MEGRTVLQCSAYSGPSSQRPQDGWGLRNIRGHKKHIHWPKMAQKDKFRSGWSYKWLRIKDSNRFLSFSGGYSTKWQIQPAQHNIRFYQRRKMVAWKREAEKRKAGQKVMKKIIVIGSWTNELMALILRLIAVHCKNEHYSGREKKNTQAFCLFHILTCSLMAQDLL